MNLINSANKKITLTAHRGAAGLAPENTLASVVKGLEWGAERIEIDVQLSKDGVVVVLHDKTLNRTTTGKGYLKNKTFGQLQQLSASRDFPLERIPSLSQVFTIINRKAILVIEIKVGDDFYPGIEKKILNTIREMGMEKHCIIHSFKKDILDRIHLMSPELELHLLLEKRQLLKALFSQVPDISGENFSDPFPEYSISNLLATKDNIRKIHHLGKKVNVWTVNDSERMKQLADFGVDGIITDRPDIFRETFPS